MRKRSGMQKTQKNSPRSLVVLHLLRENGPMSRKELAQLAGVSLPTLGKYLQSFREKGWIAEVTQSVRGAHGRRFFGLNPQFGPALGVEIGGKTLRWVVADLQGNILAFGNEDVGREKALDVLEACVKGVSAQWALKALGIASSGIVEARRGFSIRSPHRNDLDNVPLRELYEQKFGFPIYVDDVSRSAAFAEWHRGVLRGERSFVYLFLDEGIGFSWAADGSLYYGPVGISGEIGHCVVEENGHLCGCGNRGCLETLASTEAIMQRATQALQMGVVSSLRGKELSIASIVEEARRGDKLCYSLITEAGEYIGKAMAQLLNILGIPLFVLGGELRQAEQLIVEPITRMVRANALVSLTAFLDVRVAVLDERAGALGVAMQALREVLEQVVEGEMMEKAGND